MDEHTTHNTHNTRTTRLLLDVTWDPAEYDNPTTWQWNHGIEPRGEGSIVVVGEVTGRDDELLTVLEELESRIVGATALAPSGEDHWYVHGLLAARRMVQDAINEHTPEPPDVDGEDLFPARPVSNTDRLTAGCLEASRD